MAITNSPSVAGWAQMSTLGSIWSIAKSGHEVRGSQWPLSVRAVDPIPASGPSIGEQMDRAPPPPSFGALLISRWMKLAPCLQRHTRSGISSKVILLCTTVYAHMTNHCTGLAPRQQDVTASSFKPQLWICIYCTFNDLEQVKMKSWMWFRM